MKTAPLFAPAAVGALALLSLAACGGGGGGGASVTPTMWTGRAL